MSNRTRLARAVLVLALLGGAACGEDGNGDEVGSGSSSGTSQGGADEGGEAAEAKVVAVRDDLFEPAEVAIATGGTLRWEWEGENPHNVQGDDFKSQIQTSGTFEHTFAEAGTFDYLCQVHPSMTASVVVADG